MYYKVSMIMNLCYQLFFYADDSTESHSNGWAWQADCCHWKWGIDSFLSWIRNCNVVWVILTFCLSVKFAFANPIHINFLYPFQNMFLQNAILISSFFIDSKRNYVSLICIDFKVHLQICSGRCIHGDNYYSCLEKLLKEKWICIYQGGFLYIYCLPKNC